MSDPLSTGPPLRADNLEHLRKQAKALLRDARAGDAKALTRLTAVLDADVARSVTLSHAQLVVARECGFPSWPKLQDELRWRSETKMKHRLGSAIPLRKGETMAIIESLKLGPIDQIGLSCTNLDEAERFYSGVLGLRLSGDVPGVMKFFACDGVNIVLFKGDSVPPNSIVYFRVQGEPGLIETKVALLKSSGAKVESDPHVIARNWNGFDVWLAFFRDPFGNLLALKSDLPAGAK
jgi:catechol 2,3-dioxygenase-like lactoylglutathione lyase family enzyme